MGKEEINIRIRNWDNECWEAEIETKRSLTLYRKYKKEIRTESEIYYNTLQSDILFKARNNTLALGWRKRHRNEETNCPLCNCIDEDLEHFLLYCQKLQYIRNKTRLLQQPYQSEILEKLLLFEKKNNNQEEYKNIITTLWKKRFHEIKQQQQQQ